MQHPHPSRVWRHWVRIRGDLEAGIRNADWKISGYSPYTRVYPGLQHYHNVTFFLILTFLRSDTAVEMCLWSLVQFSNQLNLVEKIVLWHLCYINAQLCCFSIITVFNYFTKMSIASLKKESIIVKYGSLNDCFWSCSQIYNRKHGEQFEWLSNT